MLKFIIVLFALICNVVAVPFGYYDIDYTFTDHSRQGLYEVLGNGIVEPAVPNIFDCSDRSAYVEWILKNHGFSTRLCMDWRGPWLKEPHSWVCVNLDNEVIYIEANSPSGEFIFIDCFSPDWDKYNISVDTVDPLGMHKFLTIYDAIADGVEESELDWWNVLKIRS